MKIGDNITFHPRDPSPEPKDTSHRRVHAFNVWTAEANEICKKILRGLVRSDEHDSIGFFLTGERGVGKTHLACSVACLLEEPDDSAWESLLPSRASDLSRRLPLKTHYVQIPSDPSVDLGLYLAGSLSGLSPEDIGVEDRTAPQAPVKEFEEHFLEATQHLGAASFGMIVLDDMSRRLERNYGSDRIARDLDLVQFLIEAASRAGLLVILILDEVHLRQEDSEGIHAALIDHLGDCCDYLWLSRNHFVEIVRTAIATKNHAQRLEVRGILNQLRSRLRHLNVRPKTFVDLYPILPDVFFALFRLRSLLPSFSPLRFALDAVESTLQGSAERLITMDFLFDRVAGELRRIEEHRPIMDSYDRLARQAIPLLSPPLQDKALCLLKGIALLTISQYQPATVRNLAHSLLLYDESDALQSYHLTSAILADLERCGSEFLRVTKDGSDRIYHLCRFGEVLGHSPSEILARDNDPLVHFPLLLYDWLHYEIPAWSPDFSTRYLRGSQSMVAPIPESEERQRGLVYFKSVMDPLWADDDLRSLDDSAYPWVLLILSPFERFYEFEQSLRELGGGLSRLMIWRPDTPTAGETECLRGLAAIRSEHDAGFSGTEAERSARARASRETHRIIHDLYVRKGRFIASSIEWSVGTEIEDRSLATYLSEHLAILANAYAAGSFPAPAMVEAAAPAEEDLEKGILRWAWILSGVDSIEAVGLAEARRVLLDWWSRVEASGNLTVWDALPDTLMTVQFWDHLKSFESGVEMIRPTMRRLREDEIGLSKAMSQVAHSFGHDEERLLDWRQSLNEVAGLLRWIPTLESEREYLLSSVPTDDSGLEQMRLELVSLLEKPQIFLKFVQREAFEAKMLRFKQAYIEYYCSAHEDALHIAGSPRRQQAKVDYVSLRNLELLSHLAHTDQSYLNRTRIIGKWLHANQCDHPAREILKTYSRCFCNFSPMSSNHLKEAVSRMNAAVQEGVDYFRTILRHCKLQIIRDLKAMKIEDYYARQIAALLSQGNMIPLDPRTIEILNKILGRHTRAYLAGIRAYREPGSTASR